MYRTPEELGMRSRIAVARKLVSYAYWMIKRKMTCEELSPWTTT